MSALHQVGNAGNDRRHPFVAEQVLEKELRPAAGETRRPVGDRLAAHRAEQAAWDTNRDLEATNNGSERALRPCAVYRKITNVFRSEWGAAFSGDWRIWAPPRSISAEFDLAQEMNSKYLTAAKDQSHDPSLLAVQDLMRLRTSGSHKPNFPAADLEAQAPDLPATNSMFAFLKAARAYYALFLRHARLREDAEAN